MAQTARNEPNWGLKGATNWGQLLSLIWITARGVGTLPLIEPDEQCGGKDVGGVGRPR
jgi:hypothetical protein